MALETRVFNQDTQRFIFCNVPQSCIYSSIYTILSIVSILYTIYVYYVYHLYYLYYLCYLYYLYLYLILYSNCIPYLKF